MKPPIKVLNLYAGIGGNRKLWENVEVTAVELDESVAAVYQKHFPGDTVIVGDAHQYLLDHHGDGWDFIWSSPPCPSHSKLNTFLVPNKHRALQYPDMKLYEEILLLSKWFGGLYSVENVVPYYPPLIEAQRAGRHLFWSNFVIKPFEDRRKVPVKGSETKFLQQILGFDLGGGKTQSEKRQGSQKLRFTRTWKTYF